MKRMIRIPIGVTFIILGIAGLILPILQGWLFLAIGSLVLSVDVKFFARIENRISRRFPRIGRALHRVKERFPILAA